MSEEQTEYDDGRQREIEFIVYGEPKPQGSKRAFSVRTKSGKSVTRVVDDNPHTKDWRQQVASVACEEWHGPPLERDVPVELTLHFVRPRPAKHFGTGRNAGKLKANAPKYPTQRPDTLKLARAVEDALTGFVWTDDSQVVSHRLFKDWGQGHCVVVNVRVISGGQ